ncbi:D-galacturonic acid reductase [Rhizoctonia solani AG-1 IA]|uniref:D-galacturonic acid reductase n=1 Tax=Thanatephorus cucumeris (strain AG1-IA) TaxID=983506 RepID=L8WZJ1_THACA|nr:D-galacturonic acid reductase [Rhizoctonia solani AG-1 IA]
MAGHKYAPRLNGRRLQCSSVQLSICAINRRYCEYITLYNRFRILILSLSQGEYTTGWTGSGASKSDKKVGVVGLTLFDLRRLGKVDKLGMVGVSGGKFPAIRQHLDEKIGQVYKDLDLTFTSYPEENKTDPEAYKAAIDALEPGAAVIIFTPDSTHYPIAKYAIERKLHVLVTKPATQLLTHHNELITLAEKNGVICWVEHHKRYDPAYSDVAPPLSVNLTSSARGCLNPSHNWRPSVHGQERILILGSRLDATSAPKLDLCPYFSYYLSSHHIDICAWMLQDKAYPTRVVASAATGIHKGTGVYTASWTAPLGAGIHSAQHFHYMAEKGDIHVDQAHRGYDVTVDGAGITWYNPFYMKYTPSETGHFDGQRGYGYISIEKFIDGARLVNSGGAKPEDFDKQGFPTIRNTVLTTAILNAGRISLDEKRAVFIEKKGDEWTLV